MNWKAFVGVLLVILAGSSVFACSSDKNPASQPTQVEQPADDQADDGDGPQGGGSGNATLIIGDEMWTFININCAYSAKETGFSDSRTSFILSSFGETDEGARTQLFVEIRDWEVQGRYEGEGTIHSVKVTDIENLEDPSVAWEAYELVEGTPEFTTQVDGKNVTADALFDDRLTESEVEEVPGTFQGTCP